MTLRLARATGGGVEFWTELPITELVKYLNELSEQIEQEAEATKRVK